MSIEGVCSTKLCAVAENMKRAHIAAVATSCVATRPKTCGTGREGGITAKQAEAFCGGAQTLRRKPSWTWASHEATEPPIKKSESEPPPRKSGIGWCLAWWPPWPWDAKEAMGDARAEESWAGREEGATLDPVGFPALQTET